MTYSHTFTGGEHYWIRFHNGTYEVRKETPDEFSEDDETVFSGHYEKCKEYINNLISKNVDYDLNL